MVQAAWSRYRNEITSSLLYNIWRTAVASSGPSSLYKKKGYHKRPRELDRLSPSKFIMSDDNSKRIALQLKANSNVRVVRILTPAGEVHAVFNLIRVKPFASHLGQHIELSISNAVRRRSNKDTAIGLNEIKLH
ncbi:hypothetical protein EVAR_25319_1 [Eumeta japonica]|uniref:Uncharacterized protein n=1 Tax=Eumeta variegata TaxID=151549 RepID=A0A4C1VMX2_EUMVA|nr:hypothetical protein EVAR_25319_1 [Eumeta japonica]